MSRLEASRPDLSASVVICAYTQKRWDQIVAAVASVRAQIYPTAQCVLVVDHNDALLERASRAFPGVEVVPNLESLGLSGARNTGVRLARGDIVAFLDDDAYAEPTWLAELLAPYSDQRVLGAGGVARAAWPALRPAWFPPEFDWVVGCSYTGLPDTIAPIRNPIGANMCFRREAFELAGGFISDMGRVGSMPFGCEETVFSIRLRQRSPGSIVVQVPNAVVHHSVSTDRATLAYFIRRCVAEGLSKAAVTAYVGRVDGLESERTYVRQVLVRGVVQGLLSMTPFDPSHGEGASDSVASPRRAVVIVMGLLFTGLGYALGRLRLEAVFGRILRIASPSPARKFRSPGRPHPE